MKVKMTLLLILNYVKASPLLEPFISEDGNEVIRQRL